MTPDALQQIVNDARGEAAAELRDILLRAARGVFQRLAVDLVPPLFHNHYRGEALESHEPDADALARPGLAGLPSLFVRIHRGPFSEEDAQRLLAAMMAVHAAQAALIVLGPVVAASVRAILGTSVPWYLDAEGLVQLMIAANVGVGSRAYEMKYVDPEYFR